MRQRRTTQEKQELLSQYEAQRAAGVSSKRAAAKFGLSPASFYMFKKDTKNKAAPTKITFPKDLARMTKSEAQNLKLLIADLYLKQNGISL